MFEITTKRDFWSWQDAGLVDAPRLDLKGIQDAYVLSRIGDYVGCRILEVGGGNSRILEHLGAPARGNECWNADKFEGVGNGPTRNTNGPSVRHANCFVGEFSPLLPDEYFDVIVSVSVVEHVPADKLEALMADSARLLRPGGRIIHAIDLYVFDADSLHRHRQVTRSRLTAYLSFGDRRDLGLRFAVPPVIDESVSFRCEFASNTDLGMNQWNHSAPSFREVREIAQSVNLQAEWVRS